MDLCLHKLISILQQLSCYYYLTLNTRFVWFQSVHEIEDSARNWQDITVTAALVKSNRTIYTNDYVLSCKQVTNITEFRSASARSFADPSDYYYNTLLCCNYFSWRKIVYSITQVITSPAYLKPQEPNIFWTNAFKFTMKRC